MSSRYILPFADVGNGIQPEDGAKLFFFEPDGVTPKDTFSDQLSTPTPNTNPVIADSNGVFGNIFITGDYKNTLKDKNDVQIFGGVVIQEFAKITDNAFVKNVDTLTIAIADKNIQDGDTLNIAERTTGNAGASIWDVVLASSVTISPGAPAVGDIVASTGGQIPALALVMRIKKNGFLNFNAIGGIADYNTTTRTGTDNLAALQAAIDAVGGFKDITSEFIYEPVPIIKIPFGNYGLDLTGLQRAIVEKNNVRIIGAGTFNTNFYQFGLGNSQEMIRFKEAYACELSQMTLDGGLPFTPDGTETFGADVPLVLDQVAHFQSKGLNITNYRIRGKQCIHLWESYFEDLRIFNGGFFGTGPVPSAGIAFDNYLQESTFFPGSESNQNIYNKVAFSVVGTYVRFVSPCFNIVINDIIAEGRTWATAFSATGESKFIIGSASDNIVINGGRTFAHSQSFVSNGVFLDVTNNGPGCKINNYTIIQDTAIGSGLNLEITDIFNNGGAHPLEVSLSIEDRGDSITDLFSFAGAGSMITGRIDYRSEKARTKDSFLTTFGDTFFSGDLTFIDDGFTVSDPEITEHVGKAQRTSSVDGGGRFDEFAVRAIANFDGGAAGGARMEKGITVTRQSTGQYTGTFTKAMPDNFYSVNLSLQIANLDDQIELGTLTTTNFTFTVRDGAGTVHDSAIICISVFR